MRRWAIDLRCGHPLARWPSWWRLAADDRWWIGGAAFALGSIALASAAAWLWQTGALTETQQALIDARREQAAVQEHATATARAAAPVPPPWWTLLPPSPANERAPAEQLSADALALAPKLGVQVLRLSMSPLPPADGAPYRATAVQVELRGPYAEVKRWLAELLARRPRTLALRSIDLRRGAEGVGTPGIEASVELRLFEPVQARR